MRRFLALFCVFALLMPAARAEENAPRRAAENYLTEVFGYTVEEAEHFQFEDDGKGTLRFWPEDHPDWVYTMTYLYGNTNCATPFRTEYAQYPGEGAVRALLRTARERGWFRHWDETAKAELLEALSANDVRGNTELLMALSPQNDSTAAEAIAQLFASCYGEQINWPPALTGFRDSVLAEYGLTLPEGEAPEPGIRQATWTRGPEENEVTLFYREVPDAFQQAFSNAHLTGWQCLTGAAVIYRNENIRKGHQVGNGLVAFEQGDRRLLCMLTLQEGMWQAVPLGENALYTGVDCRIGYERNILGFSIAYTLSDTESACFLVNPAMQTYDGYLRGYCEIRQYIHTDRATGEQLQVRPGSIGQEEWQYIILRPGEESNIRLANPSYICYLGAMDINDFPTCYEQAAKMQAPLLPEGCELTNTVHLRSRTSSRSGDLGTLFCGTVIRAKEVLPGDPNPWIRTQIGDVKGYLVSEYTTMQGHIAAQCASPLPVAKTRGEVSLKKGTGLMDGTVCKLPAGTKMHVIMEKGNWLWVVVPRAELGWFMDVDGTYGYLKKSDVLRAGMACQLDWLD